MIVLIGESASGKSTIEKRLANAGYNKIVSYTTRPIREGEVDGVDYHYISHDDFKQKIEEGFFAEFTTYNDWYYGIAVPDCLNDSVVVVEPFGFRQLQKIVGLDIISFYIKVNERTRLIRMIKRGDNILESFRRLFSDQGVFQRIEDEVDFVIDNNDGNEGSVDILNILRYKAKK